MEENPVEMVVQMLGAMEPYLAKAPKEVQAAAGTLLQFFQSMGGEGGAVPAPGGAEMAGANPNAQAMR